MTAPFAFPKDRHARSQTPKQLGNYRAYKPILRKEFNGQCVYCRMPDLYKREAFGVDHYRPFKHFPALERVYANLFYACNACNSRKGAHWPVGKNAAEQVIPNPCDMVMTKHLRFRGEMVEPQSVAGEFTSKLLDLNAPQVVKIRATIIGSIELAESSLAEFKRTIWQVKRQVKAKQLAATAGVAAVAKLDLQIVKVNSLLVNLRGGII